jgi:hypothetical protein
MKAAPQIMAAARMTTDKVALRMDESPLKA